MALTEITSKGIKDATVATSDIANDAVTGDKIADGTITTALIADDAISLAKLAQGTDGQVLTYDASGNPVAVGPGTDGQVLTSTGAGSPPAFEDVPAGGATLTGSTNNTVVTVTGANAMAGEANLTFDGSKLEVKTSAATTNDLINAVNVNASTTGTAAAGVGTKMTFWGSMTGQNDVELGQIGFHNNNVSGAYGDFVVKTRPNGTSVERLRVDSGGDVTVKTGDIVFGTAGKGICLGVTSNTDSNTLDDYEEGIFTITGSNSITIYDDYNTGSYIKIGNLVHCQGMLRVLDGNSSSHFGFHLPFTAVNGLTDQAERSVCSCSPHNWNLPSSETNVAGVIEGGNTQLNFFMSRDDQSRVDVLAYGDAYMDFSITYRAA
jgi:hypothetical protein